MKTKRKKKYNTKKYKTKKYNTKKYKTKKYNTKKYKTKKYNKAKGLKEAKCGRIMGECFRGNCGECMECFELLNNEDNSNPIFNKQYKIPEYENPFIPKKNLKRDNPLTKSHLMRQKHFKLSKTNDAKIGREIALQILGKK